MDANIVFIVLTSDVKSRIVCELAEKCYLSDKRVVIYSKQVEECKKIDTLLWTWKQNSFIPHIYIDELSAAHREPIIVTTKINTLEDYDTLILMDPLPLKDISQFGLVIDFAEKYDSHALAESRERFKIYRDKMINIETMQPGEFLHSYPLPITS